MVGRLIHLQISEKFYFESEILKEKSIKITINYSNGDVEITDLSSEDVESFTKLP